MLIYMNECLLASDNLLQCSLSIVLGSMEMIAQLRVASILHLAVVMPMRWLAGNTHKLSEYGWGEHSMGRAITFLHNAFVEVQGDGVLLLKENFIMNIFSPLYKEIPPLKEYHFEEKEGNMCVFLASGYGWGTVMHEIPISTSHPLTSLPYPRTQ
jgi:hypothetical protein